MPDKQYEIRSTAAEFTAQDSGEGPVIEGYFAVFGAIYDIWPGELAETIAPTAFDNIAGRDVRALIDHDTRLVLGRTGPETLTLSVDGRGLYGVIKINPDDGDAMNLYARVQRGDVSQCSFGFDIVSETYADRADGTTLCTINSVTLYEVSVVTFPAYETTAVCARSARIDDLRRRRVDAWREKVRRKFNHGN